MTQIALLSVSDKRGLIPLAKELVENYGFKLISSGGTSKLIEEAKIPVTRVADYTGAPEILEGRVKTLHPKIHGGILAKRESELHTSQLLEQNIDHINLVVVNLYPFQKTIADPNVSWDNAIENIDIGGPTLVRAAAKNHDDVTVLTRIDQYDEFLKTLKSNNGNVPIEFRRKLALEAFEHTATYDVDISNWISTKISTNASPFLKTIPLKQRLRYGENPHQKANWFSLNNGWGNAKQLQGKELSTNNLLDLEASIRTLLEFGYEELDRKNSFSPAAVVVKHTNPCGVAVSDHLENALIKALDGDRISAFGGIIALNKEVNKSTANELLSLFLECVVAPKFTSEALEILSQKNNLRLLEIDSQSINKANKQNLKSILGGVLVQDQDSESINTEDWEIVTEKIPSKSEEEDLKFAWKVVKHVHSNAIVIASSGQTIGIGAGQMNRVGSAKIAFEASKENCQGAVLASDGFFPFDDTVRLAADYGISAIIQPGGSIKDQDSINACNELGLTMIHTKKRHFLH